MKKIHIVSFVLFLLIFTGCTQQAVDNGDSKDGVTEKIEVKKEEVKKDGIEPKINNQPVLDLRSKGLKKVPDYVFGMTGLKELNLSNNVLEGALPGEIRFLKNLVKLDVSKNNMTGIPAEIGQLENLEVLNYASNGITGLPLEIGNLKNLKIFDLSSNDYSKYDLDIIKKQLPNLEVIID